MQFIIGRTYSTRSICDHNCIFSITIASRTAKTIKTTEGKTLRIGGYNGIEAVKPFGTYSMCAVISADDKDLTAVVHPAYADTFKSAGKLVITDRETAATNVVYHDFRKAV